MTGFVGYARKRDDSIVCSSIAHIFRNISVKLRTASPRSITAVSFQCPKRTTRLMYSSARFTPPVNANCPSITAILRWSR